MNKDHKVSDLEFNNIIASWWRNQEYDKLKALKKIEKIYASRNQSHCISNADKLERAENLANLKKK